MTGLKDWMLANRWRMPMYDERRARASLDRMGLPDLAPHAGREAMLMGLELKPLAMFYDVLPRTFEHDFSAFEPLLATGRIVQADRYVFGDPENHHYRGTLYTYFALREEAWRIDIAHLAHLHFEATNPLAVDLLVGLLLGYSERQAAVYLQHMSANRTRL